MRFAMSKPVDRVAVVVLIGRADTARARAVEVFGLPVDGRDLAWVVATQTLIEEDLFKRYGPGYQILDVAVLPDGEEDDLVGEWIQVVRSERS